MAAKIFDIKNFSPKSSDIFFFDNNIWMYLFCPIGNYNQKKQRAYSGFLQSVQTSRAMIFISSLILSEFANRYLRMDFEQWKNTSGKFSADFKINYVGSSQYLKTADELNIQINKIMRLCEKSSDNFNAINLNDVFTHLRSIDFNDSYYIELAKLGNWKIVTDDRDFTGYKNHNLSVITFIS
jgi:predicted nucleic acid-binding protein